MTKAAYEGSLKPLYNPEAFGVKNRNGALTEVTIPRESITMFGVTPRLGLRAKILDFDSGLEASGRVTEVNGDGSFNVLIDHKTAVSMEASSMAEHTYDGGAVGNTARGAGVILLSVLVVVGFLLGGVNLLQKWVAVNLVGGLLNSPLLELSGGESPIMLWSLAGLAIVFTPIISTMLLRGHWARRGRKWTGLLGASLNFFAATVSFYYILAMMWGYQFQSPFTKETYDLFFDRDLGDILTTGWSLGCALTYAMVLFILSWSGKDRVSK